MILFVNGDSHTAAAEAVNSYAFSEDDPALPYLGRTPHPDNLAVSWGRRLADSLKAGFHCAAESGSSNARILRTTRDWVEQHRSHAANILMIIQWSTWEREEWAHGETYLQVGASGTDHVPQVLQEKYRNFVSDMDWALCTQQAHQDIWQLHTELQEQGIKHIFFNGNNDFAKITDQKDWGVSYIGPYDHDMTYDRIIQAKGIHTVSPNSWHFGSDGHGYFHRFLLNYIMRHKFI
jgi:hypothetical protein